MDGLMLLAEAQRAGLTVTTKGDKLVVRGPKRAESIARKLLEHKPELMRLLAPPELPERPKMRPGYLCELTYKGGKWSWRFRRPDAADHAWQVWRQAGGEQ